jgi:pantetheine-phosphate adenylyltransferase
MKAALYPGSFDPITNGHLDIIERSAKVFGKLIVAALDNGAKKPLFSADERVALIERCVAGLGNVEVARFEGLLVDFARLNNVSCVIKGLRAISDFEYEFQMALLNKHLNREVETLFMVTDANFSYISSSVVKEIALLGGRLDGLVPPCVAESLRQKIEAGKGSA